MFNSQFLYSSDLSLVLASFYHLTCEPVPGPGQQNSVSLPLGVTCVSMILMMAVTLQYNSYNPHSLPGICKSHDQQSTKER